MELTRLARIVLASVGCASVLASGSYAANLTIKGSVSENVSASDNYFLNNNPHGPTVRSDTAFLLHAQALTALTKYNLDANFDYFRYFGPGTADTNLQSGTPMGVRFALDHSIDQLTRFNALASWQRSDLATAQLIESGLVTTHGFADTYLAQTGLTRDLSRLDSVSWSATGTHATFSGSDQLPYLDFATNSVWKHQITPNLTASQMASLDWFASQDAQNQQRLLWTLSSTLDLRLSQRLALKAMGGLVLVNAWNQPFIGSNSFALATGGAHQEPIWSLGAVYRIDETTTANAGISKTIAPTILGDLQQSMAVQVGLGRQINRHSSIGVASQFSQISSAQTGQADLFTASIQYSYSFTRELRATLSYAYNQRSDDTGTAHSNLFMASLIRDFTILP